ncbi:MAG: TIGR04282 family arsenosugar biosynthesis glycosyltransferase [Deltaproteobacteria bacterium]
MPSAPQPQRALVVFARAPEPGRVKTRLAREIGEAAALEAYRELGTAVMGAVGVLRDCEVVVAYTPAEREGLVRGWLGSVPGYEPQPEGDLGARMLGAIARRCAAGAERVLVIGTDCPDLDARLLETAFARLGRADAVLGPAADGGYYLVGMKRPIPELFREIPWSTPATLSATLARAAGAGVSVALLEERRDVDTAEDWRAWRAARHDPGTSHQRIGLDGGGASPAGR